MSRFSGTASFVLAVALAAGLASAACSSAPPPSAGDLATRIAATVPGTAPGAVLSAENDPNNLLGRPGQYISAAVVADPRVPAADRGEPTAVDQGAKVEVFAEDNEAETREQYVTALAQSGSPLTAGYTYRSGPVVVRVSSRLPPAAAEQYRSALQTALEQ